MSTPASLVLSNAVFTDQNKALMFSAPYTMEKSMFRKRMIQTCFAVSLILGLFATAGAHEAEDDHEPRIVTPEEQFKASPLPDRIVLTWSMDPAHTQDVNWRTDESVHKAFIEYAVAESGPKFIERAVRVNATTTPFTSNLGSYHLHNVRLEALEPQAKYVYRVGDGKNWSEWFHFSTASEEAKPFSFIYFGDAQNSVRAHWSRVIREAHLDAPRASLMLHAGDLVNRGSNDAEWGEWFGAGSWLNGMIPSIATPGNHEYPRRTDGGRHLTPHWRAQFAFPQNGPEGLEESVYWMDYQGVRFVSLNSNEQQQAQVAWLQNVLSENPHRWTIVTFHHPIFSSSRGRDNPLIRKLWKPIFDKHGVDLVLQGHDHSYARTGLDVPENLDVGTNVKSGNTVYVVSVSGPKMYQTARREFFKSTAQDTQLYQIISIDGDALLYEAKTATGKRYDAFTLEKAADGKNTLVELETTTAIGG